MARWQEKRRLTDLEVDAGDHIVSVTLDRYQPFETAIFMEGRQTKQRLDIELLPAWAEVSINTRPAGAVVSVDGQDRWDKRR